MLIKNGNVYLGNGHYEQGWDVLCEGQKIKAVGPSLSAEAGRGSQVIDAAGRDVYPGLVLGLSSMGVYSFSEILSGPDLNETSSPVNPQLDVRDAYDLREVRMQRLARTGVTSYGLCPGASPLIGGQVSLVHSWGQKSDDVFIKERIGVKGNFTKTVKDTFSPKNAFTTRMGMYGALDKAFRDAKIYMEADGQPFDADKEVLARLLRRQIPFIVAAETESEIASVIELGEKYGLQLVLTGAYGMIPFAETIMGHGWHVMLGDTGYMASGLRCAADLATFVDLYRRGLQLSITCSGDVGYPPAYEQLLWQAARMSAAGAEGFEIMDMMTSTPAEALGAADLIGSLKPGAFADIIITGGNPAVRFDCAPDLTIIAGEIIYAREVR